jgi:thiamine monophosphate synthase|tara:strand:- start:3 stop:563 length:561 start_codon:yes stop_codon:yes gene_type:complete
MFIIKNKYYLYIENTQSIDLNYFKKNKKISIIYRNNGLEESYTKLNKFRQKCKNKKFMFYVANNYKLATACKADGLYLSSYNKKIYPNFGYNLIGSAHSFKEIYEKIKQGCNTVVLSRLFETSYNNKRSYMGVPRFNLISKNCQAELIPLGGINNKNLLKLNMVDSKGLCLFSEIKKKPAISNRLF